MRRSFIIEKLVCASLLVLAIASVAHASKLPVGKVPAYDVDATCALPFNGDRSRTNACIEEEQGAYEHLRAVWLSHPALLAFLDGDALALGSKLNQLDAGKPTDTGRR